MQHSGHNQAIYLMRSVKHYILNKVSADSVQEFIATFNVILYKHRHLKFLG